MQHCCYGYGPHCHANTHPTSYRDVTPSKQNTVPALQVKARYINTVYVMAMVGQ